jgi:hypothetical protein
MKAVRDRAKLAGLGHVATHDLRRSAAGILHHATTDDGAHRYDLLDIQKVLGHADPATAMRSYLDPMDTCVIGRAATKALAPRDDLSGGAAKGIRLPRSVCGGLLERDSPVSITGGVCHQKAVVAAAVGSTGEMSNSEPGSPGPQ